MEIAEKYFLGYAGRENMKRRKTLERQQAALVIDLSVRGCGRY